MGPDALPTHPEPQEAPVPIDLSPREWQLVDAIRARKPPVQIAEEWGTTRQNVDNIRRALARKGVINRDKTVPVWMKYSEQYPWTVADGVDLRYAPALPPEATFRVLYPQDPTPGLEVPTIRVVRWDAGGWTVQGVPAARLDGSVGVMTHRVVWCVRDDGRSWAFPAPVDHEWMDDHTVARFEHSPAREHRLRLTPELRENLTLMVAAVLAVDPVISTPNPR